MEKNVKIKEEYIRLDSFLKLCGAADTGGRAKIVIQEGYVQVNGEVCTQRGKKLRSGDRVTFDGESYVCDRATV